MIALRNQSSNTNEYIYLGFLFIYVSLGIPRGSEKGQGHSDLGTQVGCAEGGAQPMVGRLRFPAMSQLVPWGWRDTPRMQSWYAMFGFRH